jgi:hypothetical protein
VFEEAVAVFNLTIAHLVPARMAYGGSYTGSYGGRTVTWLHYVDIPPANAGQALRAQIVVTQGCITRAALNTAVNRCPLTFNTYLVSNIDCSIAVINVTVPGNVIQANQRWWLQLQNTRPEDVFYTVTIGPNASSASTPSIPSSTVVPQVASTSNTAPTPVPQVASAPIPIASPIVSTSPSPPMKLSPSPVSSKSNVPTVVTTAGSSIAVSLVLGVFLRAIVFYHS